MDESLKHDLASIESLLDAAKDMALCFLQSLDQRPAAAIQPPHFEHIHLVESGIGAIRALEALQERFGLYLSASPGPRYLGFVTGGSTPAALAGDWLVSAFDQNAQRNGDTCATRIELDAIGFLRELFALPERFCGTFVTGATMSNAMGIAVARQWLGMQRGIDVAADGLVALGPIRVLSGAMHSSVRKAMSLCGLGRNAYFSVRCLPDREAIDIVALREILEEDPHIPTIVVANVGTVNTVDFDDLEALVALRQLYPFWLHIDGAFGAFAACSPQYAHYVRGLDGADSLTVDAHKWLNVPYDSAMFFTAHLDMQLQVFQNISSYLAPPVLLPDNMLHLAPENSRRLRALPVWLTLQAYGRRGYQEIVERCCAHARRLQDRLIDDARFFVCNNPARLNVVCFVPLYNGVRANQFEIKAFLDRVQSDGTTFCTSSFLDGMPMIRAAFSNWRTTSADVERIADALLTAYESS